MKALIDDLVTTFSAISEGKLLVVTGAGISRASGIPTFRGTEPGAIWRTSDVTLATFHYFQRDPVGQWQWYLKRFAAVQQARPNAAHQALSDLERWFVDRGGNLEIVTQNIDTLHERAGSTRLIKVHGTSDRVRCSRNGCVNGAPTGSLSLSQVDFSPFVADPQLQNLPRCPICQALLRAHVLFFDEYYLEHADYRFRDVESLAREADAILFVGTSFSVGVTDLFLQAGTSRGVPMFSIDPASQAATWPNLKLLAAPAERLLPAVCAVLAEESPDQPH
jgi:NAD-dependent deacetylase